MLPDAAVYAVQKLVVDNASLNRDWVPGNHRV